MKIMGATGLVGLWAWEIFFLVQSIGIDETNTYKLKFCTWHENCGRHRFGRFVDIRVGVAYSRNKLALRTRLRNPNLRSHFSIFNNFRDIRVHIYDFFKFVDIKVANFFWVNR